MIPRQVVERVIERVSIVEVISDYVPLHGRGLGRSLVGWAVPAIHGNDSGVEVTA